MPSKGSATKEGDHITLSRFDGVPYRFVYRYSLQTFALLGSVHRRLESRGERRKEVHSSFTSIMSCLEDDDEMSFGSGTATATSVR